MAESNKGPRFLDGGKDVLCFTAGTKGTAFAAGVTHAYLAADRKPPVCVTIVSFGAV